MSSVVVSGDSSEGAPSQATGGEDNPIELDDSSTNTSSNSNCNSENENETETEITPGPLIFKEEGSGNSEGTDNGDESESDRNGDNEEEEEEDDDDDEEDDYEDSEEDCDGENSDGDEEINVDAGKTVEESVGEEDSEQESKCDNGNKDNDGSSDNDNDDENHDPPDSNNSSAKDCKDSSKTTKTTKNLWGNIESMSEIVKSPYEGNECAEVGEDCFEEFRLLMDSRESDDTINPQMIALVGDKLARDLCNAHHEIGKSGMLYSANWKEGKIRDSDFGWIPKRQLLLCLHEHRFAKGGVVVLQAVTKNLDCTKLVLEAMKLWDLMDAYPNLASNKNDETFAFGPQKVFCYKCQIFVARAFATLQILNKTEGIQQSLTKKMKACLGVMNKYVRVNQIELARMKKKALKRKALQAPCSEEPNAVTSKIPRSRGSKVAAPSTKVRKPRGPYKPRVPATSTNSAKKPPRKRRRKVPKREEREESIFMLFNTMHMQVQRLNQMMSFFQSQLQDHRGIMREEIRENLENDGNDVKR